MEETMQSCSKVIGGLVAVLLTASDGFSQTVSGAFAIGGKPFKPRHVAAFRVRSQNAPRTMETYVMLTLKPVAATKIAADIDPYAAAINDPAVTDADYLALFIAGSGETQLNAHIGGTQYIDSSGELMGQKGSLSSTCRENTAGRVACSVKTVQPVKSTDGPAWTLDVTFASNVLARTPGKPLPADGGPAGKALLELVSAVAGRSLAPILAGLSPDQAASFQESYRTPAENLESAKEILGARLPKKPKITGGEQLAADRVLLEVEGTPFEGMRNLYLVEMSLLEGRWRWVGSIPAGVLH
jgi:hypothetical protein